MTKIAVTCGDVNGIGLEISLKAFLKLEAYGFESEVVFIAPENVLEKALKQFSVSKLPKFVSAEFIENTELNVGKPTRESGHASFAAIRKALNLIEENKIDALVTAPLSKEALALAGIKYKGHTDMLAEFSGTENYLMTFISDKFKTALATIHVPIAQVPGLLSKEKLCRQIKLLENTARNDFGISAPKIAVLGLNPHAGENGNIGKEEMETIVPAIDCAKNQGIAADGPFVPDAFFANGKFAEYDFVFGMYHDQVLIPFKMINFNEGVNFTAGLPFVRTSPDHGTAFDIAWKGIADPSSMLNAVLLAEKIHSFRKNAKN